MTRSSSLRECSQITHYNASEILGKCNISISVTAEHFLLHQMTLKDPTLPVNDPQRSNSTSKGVLGINSRPSEPEASDSDLFKSDFTIKQNTDIFKSRLCRGLVLQQRHSALWEAALTRCYTAGQRQQNHIRTSQGLLKLCPLVFGLQLLNSPEHNTRGSERQSQNFWKFQLILGFFFFTFPTDWASQTNKGMLAQRNSTEALETTLRKPTIKADMLNTKSHGYCPRLSNMANMRACERVSQVL